VDEENLDADHDDAPLWVRAIDDLIGDAEPPGLARRVLNVELNFTSAEEPMSFKKAEHDAAWRAAMREEMKVIEDNDTWELTSLPAGHRAIGLKCVSSLVLVRLIVLSVTGERADGRSQQKPTVNPSKSRRQEPTVDPSKNRRSIPTKTDGKSRRLIPTEISSSCTGSSYQQRSNPRAVAGALA
jgi:hypothetical protein